jgi:hypothetical protein
MRARAGSACDFEFVLRVAHGYPRFWFVDEFVYCWRQHRGQRCSDEAYTNISFDLVRSAALPASLEHERNRILKCWAGAAVQSWLRKGERRGAAQVYLSRYYGWRGRLSAKGMFQAALLCTPRSLWRVAYELRDRFGRESNEAAGSGDDSRSGSVAQSHDCR